MNKLLFSFCLSIGHILHHYLIIYKVQRFLQCGSWILDKQGLLHGGGHRGD